MTEIFEWERLLFNNLPPIFLLEVLFRSLVMFLVLLAGLRMTGKRGVKQLSIFETVIIIALGSAAGDPMFYEEVGLVPSITVLAVVISMYRLITYLTGKSRWFEELMEGKTVLLIEDGVFSIVKFKKESIAQDEFFSELRLRSIDHLGQVRQAYLEPSGDLSVYFLADEDVKPGLPLFPALFNKKSKTINSPGVYSCSNCGFTQYQSTETAICTVCNREEWVKSIDSVRVK